MAHMSLKLLGDGTGLARAARHVTKRAIAFGAMLASGVVDGRAPHGRQVLPPTMVVKRNDASEQALAPLVMLAGLGSAV